MSINNVDQRPSQLLSTLMLHGYARVSTIEQNPDAQHDALVRAGVHPDQIYVDRTSGAKSSRPAWDALVKGPGLPKLLSAAR